MKFSVLLSVYERENPIFFKEALESILIYQSVLPDEVVIVKDGPLTKELDEVIEDIKKNFSDIVKVVPLKTNLGLGKALKTGLSHCKFDIVARMDSDDISHELRFEKQLEEFKKKSDVAVVGSYIAEFFDNRNDIRFIREVPTSFQGIKDMGKRRNPMNHVTVMFKKSKVLKSGSYKHLYFLEDYYLWIRMIANNYMLTNLEEVLVYVRTGEDMFRRRSNRKYIKSWFELQREMYKLKYINIVDVMINMVNIIGFIYTPASLKEYIYKFFLRKGFNE